MLDEVIAFVSENYTWLIPGVFSVLSFFVILLKKGKVSSSDLSKIVATEKVVASALSILLEKEKLKNDETQSKEKREEVSQD